MNESTLNTLWLSKSISYKIAPKMKNITKNSYDETLKSLNILQISEVKDILTIIAIILNLGNVKFHLLYDVYTVKIGKSMNH